MNRTIKEATVERFHYDTHDQLASHLADFVLAYNYARRLKTLKGLTPYESICKIWTREPERFTLDPIHQMPGLNSVFAVEVLQRSGEEVQMRIHISGTEWHHWQGSFWAHECELRPITSG